MNRAHSVALILVVLLLATLALASCDAPFGDPYAMGQWVRQQLEQLVEDFNEFLAGFCGAPAVAGLGALVLIWRTRARA